MKYKKTVLVVILLFVLLISAGCNMRPYEKPKFVEIQPHQTAFVIPLTGKTSEQGQFESETFLLDNQVAAKRIQVARTWYKSGRLPWTGSYKDDVRVIVVDRFPETREWLSDVTRGTSDKAEGFIGESKDSIKFKVGFSATASIEEPDASKFLYKYNNKTLQEVMDFEIRNRIGTTLLEKYGSMSMKDIRESKKEVIVAVREEVIPFFKEMGISLTNLGYVGDLEYVDKAVQEAINERFVAEEQQQTQDTRNATEIKKAKAERTAIEERKATLSETVRLRELELQAEWIKKWDGKAPSVISGNGSESFLFNIDKFDEVKVDKD